MRDLGVESGSVRIAGVLVLDEALHSVNEKRMNEEDKPKKNIGFF